VGCLAQRFAPLVLLLVLGAAVPFALPLLRFSYSKSMVPLMPVGGATTETYLDIDDKFGLDYIIPNTLILVPFDQGDLGTLPWQRAACQAMRYIAGNVSDSLSAQGYDAALKPEDFLGVMIIGGYCVGELDAALHLIPGLASQLSEHLIATFGNDDLTATKVHVSSRLDMASDAGAAWIRAVRDAAAAQQTTDGTYLGQIYLTGMGPENLDAASETFASLPLVMGSTLAIVCVVLTLAFRSLLVPVRAVLCLCWMLAVTFGAAVIVYQDGALAGLGLSPFAPCGDALTWMAPCITFSIVVGLGLDYDVFLMESVVEHYDMGLSGREAMQHALAHTGCIISIAGIIMFLAFGALLLGSSPALQQIGFILCLGVLLDCFVTTKVIIPAVMALLSCGAGKRGDPNFWPRQGQRSVLPPPPLRKSLSAVSSRQNSFRAPSP